MLRWTGRLPLAKRILAVNIFALAMLAGGFFYLDSFRQRLLEQRQQMVANELVLVSAAIRHAPRDQVRALLQDAGRITRQRLRLYGSDGKLQLDSWSNGDVSYTLRDPAEEDWERHAARLLDRVVERIAGASAPPAFSEPDPDTLSAWPEAVEALKTNALTQRIRRAPDRTPVLSAAVAVPGAEPRVLLSTINTRDIIRNVRAERLRLGILLALVIGVSVLLSLFLARTIVVPLRKLAHAAHQVRRGRAREVQVPRLPSRRDEVGQLARAISDMSQALRQRMDATEAFAADVTHELKNPLASLRSAVDSLAAVSDPELQKKLISIIEDDVRRIDRLITDISEASRVDAELSRANFEPIDLGPMLAGMIEAREERRLDGDVRIAFARPRVGTAVVMGDGSRLARAISNLIDNAVSFSPPGGLVQLAATRDGDSVLVRVEDEGPGVPANLRSEIFNRFHSIRPDHEDFGRHSGLGLAIARAIIEGHGGRIEVEDREDGRRGAAFLIHLPVRGAPRD